MVDTPRSLLRRLSRRPDLGSWTVVVVVEPTVEM